ncbi:MAG: Ada metal-binding domain-containing protein [Eubacteriales bacterium]
MKTYLLLDSQGKPYESEEKGTLGGHKKLKIYGRLDCPSALRYIEKGQYVSNRVFFLDETTAISAGYRPCAVCMKAEYKIWKENQKK